MARVLLTAFGPYGSWESNASWLALTELTRELPSLPQVTTRLYPTDYLSLRQALETDLQREYDYTLHLGQSPGSAQLCLEAIGLNVAGTAVPGEQSISPLCDDGPVAFRSRLPLVDWVHQLRQVGIPASVSFHAGSYLCNATLFLAHYLIERTGRTAYSGFIHVPLDTAQVVDTDEDLASLPRQKVAEALQMILGQLKSAPIPVR